MLKLVLSRKNFQIKAAENFEFYKNLEHHSRNFDLRKLEIARL